MTKFSFLMPENVLLNGTQGYWKKLPHKFFNKVPHFNYVKSSIQVC